MLRYTAYQAMTRSQMQVTLTVVALLCIASVVSTIDGRGWLIGQVVVATGVVIMVGHFAQKLLITIVGSVAHYPHHTTVPDHELPPYAVLVAAYGEKRNTLEQLVTNMAALDYPADRLDVRILVDADDLETRAILDSPKLQECLQGAPTVQVQLVHAPLPGKPKALCAGYAAASAHAPEFIAVFDAEDKPAPDQLKKAVAAFRAPGNEKVGCAQARLAFPNRTSTAVTHFMFAEYAGHFGWLIKGMSLLKMVIPLGGTSNHFRTAALDTVAAATDMPELPLVAQQEIGQHLAWDVCNVTEDADLAFALQRLGWYIVPFDSFTDEEAPLTVRIAYKQRSRWHKGFIQTALVALRQPAVSIRQMGLWRWVNFIVFVGGTPLSLLLLPLYAMFTALTFTPVGKPLGQLMPWSPEHGALIITATVALIIVQQVAVCVKHRAWSSIPVMLLLPLWWLVLVAATLKAAWEMRSHDTRTMWSHTEHGVELPGKLEQTAQTDPSLQLKGA